MPADGQPTLMLYSVVDDRSGVAYQEYRCTYGEAVEAALQFLFNAMAPKADVRFPFGGRPRHLYLDNGPVARSHVFQHVMGYLDIEVQAASPQRPRWPPHDGPLERQGRAAVPHGERGPRDLVPLPRTAERNRSQCLAVQLSPPL